MDLEKLFTLKDRESLIHYIDSVIIQIEQNTTHEDEIGFEHATPHLGIIDKETMITNVDMVVKFTDNEYAYRFVEGLIKYNIHDIGPAMNYVYYFIRSYFGLEGDHKNREVLLSSNADEYSISDLKGKNAAVCADRAAVAQNLFSILGMESYYIVGQINGENHAFNVVNYKGNYYLYDSSKDIPKYENGKIVNWLAYVKPISKEQLEALFNGEKITFEDGRIYSSFGKYKIETSNKSK